jgi:hypothetical protein
MYGIQAGQASEGKSAHFVTARLPQGIPLSLSLETYSI